MKRILLLGLVFALGVSAKTHHCNIPYHELTLSDGRTFKDGKIQSYDDITETVIIISGRSIVKVPVGQLPNSITGLVFGKVPHRSDAAISKEQQAYEKTLAEAKIHQAWYEQKVARKAAEIRKKQLQTTNISRPNISTTTNRATISRIERRVQEHAKLHFKTARAVGVPSSSGYRVVHVVINNTQTITGWKNRFRTKGIATIEPVRRGRAYQQHFEVVSEITEKNYIQIIDTVATNM